MDIQNDIRVYDFASNTINEGKQYPTMSQSKKHVPKFSFTKAKQFTLWNEERKRAYVTPGPSSYNAT